MTTILHHELCNDSSEILEPSRMPASRDPMNFQMVPRIKHEASTAEMFVGPHGDG